MESRAIVLSHVKPSHSDPVLTHSTFTVRIYPSDAATFSEMLLSIMHVHLKRTRKRSPKRPKGFWKYFSVFPHLTRILNKITGGHVDLGKLFILKRGIGQRIFSVTAVRPPYIKMFSPGGFPGVRVTVH